MPAAHAAGHVVRDRAAAVEVRGGHVGHHGPGRRDPLAVARCARRCAPAVGRRRCASPASTQRISPPSDSMPPGQRPGELTGAALGDREARRSARACVISRRHQARTRARRAGCRRARRCRRAAGRGASPAEPVPAEVGGRREQRPDEVEPARPTRSRASTAEPGRTGGNGRHQRADEVRRRSGPTARTARSHASPSPGCCSSRSRGGHARGRGAAAPTTRPGAGGPSTAGACRQRRPCPRGRGDRIVGRGRCQRVERAERVVHEARRARPRRCGPLPRRPAAPRAPARDQPLSSRWLAATRPLGPDADHDRVVASRHASRPSARNASRRRVSTLRHLDGRALHRFGHELPGPATASSSISTRVPAPGGSA